MVNKLNDNGQNALHLAVIRKNLSKVELLVKSGEININDKDDNGMTPLHYAADGGCKEIIEYLIKNNAKIDLKDQDGRIPLDIVKYRHNKEAVNLLDLIPNPIKKTNIYRPHIVQKQTTLSSELESKLKDGKYKNILNNTWYLSSAATYFGEAIRSAIPTNLWSNVATIATPVTNFIGNISKNILSYSDLSPIEKISTLKFVKFIAPVQIILGAAKASISFMSNLYSGKGVAKSSANALWDGGQTIAESTASSIGLSAGATAASYLAAGTVASVALPIMGVVVASYGVSKIGEYSKDATSNFVEKYLMSSNNITQHSK